VTLPATDGSGTLVAALRQLDHADIAVEDVSVRRPSLDEVFLALTGRPAGADATGTPHLDATPLTAGTTPERPVTHRPRSTR
jgi:hypothetical protein